MSRHDFDYDGYAAHRHQMPLWQYGGYAFAVAATLCLAAANVAWAWSLPDGVYRYVMIAVSVAADIGAPCALMAMMHYQGEGDPGSALAAFVVWAFCGYAEVHGAEVWLKSNSFVIASPAMKAGEAQQAAAAELETETANLIEIRGLLARERRRSRLEHLQRREKAALERIDALKPQTFAATVEPARSQYVGNELALAFALWLLSQVAWRMAVGRLHGSAQTASRGAPSGRSPVQTVRDVDDAELSGRLVSETKPRCLMDTSDSPSDTSMDTLPCVSDTLSDGHSGHPDGPSSPPRGGGQLVVRTKKDTVQKASGRSAPRPRLEVVRTPKSASDDQTAFRPDTVDGVAASDTPDTVDAVSLRTVPDGMTADQHQRICDYHAAGFSIRKIAAETGVIKWRVEAVIRGLKENATKGREKG